MTLSQLNSQKSNHATWMLAIVVFLSGFCFSGSTEYSKVDQTKAKTEVVVDSKVGRKKTAINPFATDTFLLTYCHHLSEISRVIRLYDQLIKVRIDSATQNYLTFRSDLLLYSAVSKIPHSDLISLL